MAVAMHGYSVGPLGMEVVHGPSGALVRTEPPVDNGGDGSRFSPTDLCAASLGVCASTILRLTAARLGIELRGVGFRYGSRGVIRGLDLEIRPGEMIGLVGHSGSARARWST